MRRKGRKLRTLCVLTISLLWGLLFFGGCSIPDPEFYASGDVLYPGPAVETLGFDDSGNPIVSPEFMIWVADLKKEIRRLRRLIDE